METPKDTVPSWIQWKSSSSPDQEAVVSYDPRLKRSSLTFSEIHHLASRFAYILKEGGMRKGEMVVNALPNCLEQVVTSLGIMMAGGVNVAVEVFLNTGETFYEVLDKTKTKLLVVQRENDTMSWNLVKDQLDTSSSTHGGLTRVKKSDKSFNLQHAFIVSRAGPNFLDYLLSIKETYCCPSLIPDDPCMVFSTSSSTSLVRLVMHTHRSIIRAGHASKVILHGEKNYFDNSPPTWVTNLPGSFLIWGTSRISLDHWSFPSTTDEHSLFADVIEKEKVEMVFMIPPFADAVVNKWKPRPLPMVKNLIVGAMPVTEKIVQKLMPAAERMTVRYMSSEVPGVCYNTFQAASHFHDFDSGVPETGLQFRTVDANYKDIEPKQTGRILIKTDAVFHSYIGESPENNSDAFTPDGWFASLDAGYQTSDGHLAVMGRRDDMILHNVWNIHPSWIEKQIKSHKDIVKVVVVPVPDDINFQNICACIIRKPGSKISADDVKEHYRSNYVNEEKDSFCPNDVLFFDQLPERTPGQIDRVKTTDLAARIILNAQQNGIPSHEIDTIKLSEVKD